MSLSRKYLDKTVYDATRERIEELFFRFDTVAVSFSGGKDSTAVLNITLEVAEELGRLPVKVVYWDEEAQYSDTIDYIARVAEDPRVDMHWYCVPIKHRNACSYKEPFWYPWNPEKKNCGCATSPTRRSASTTCRGSSGA